MASAAPRKKKPKTLLVDLDGTLLDNDEFTLTLSFFSKILSRLKRFGRMRVLKGARAIFKEFETASETEVNAVRFSRVFGARLGLGQVEARALLEGEMRAVFPKLGKHFEPSPGAAEFLAWAKGRYPMVLATNPVWPQDIIELRLRWAGHAAETFDWVTDWTKMRAVKPLPEYYKGILEARGLMASECLMIGDSKKKDLPAQKLGIPVFILDDDYRDRDEPIVKRIRGSDAHKGNFLGLKKMLG